MSIAKTTSVPYVQMYVKPHDTLDAGSTAHSNSSNRCTPNDTSSSNTAANDTSSSNTAAKGTSSSNTAAKGTSSSNTAANDTSSSNTAANDPSSSNTAANDTSSSNTAANDTSSSNTAAKGTSSSNTAANDTSSSNTAANDPSSSNTAANDTSSSNTAANDTSSSNTAAKETSSSNTAAKETSSSNTAAKETSSNIPVQKNHLKRIKMLFASPICCVATAGITVIIIVIVVVAVTVSLTKKSKDTCDLTPSHKKGNFQESDFLASVSFQMSWSPDLNPTDSKTYNETLIGVWDWVSAIFEHSAMSSCFSVLATGLIINGSQTSVDLQLHVTCQNVSENQVTKAYEEGHNTLTSKHPRCIDSISQTITVKKNQRISSTIPTPSDIPDTMCGQSQLYPRGRIFGGAPTHRGQYPWVVLLLNDSRPLCGGTIWDYDIILTAAHCVSTSLRDRTTGELDTTLLDIIAGKWEFNPSLTHYEQNMSVTSGRIHPNYDGVSYHNDIALLKLAHPLQPTQLVMKVCLPLATDLLPPTGIVAGWGATSSDPNKPAYPLELQFVELNIYNYTDCIRFFGPLFTGSHSLSFHVNNGTVCAANGVNGGKDSCQGDSGGPLFQNVGTARTQRYTIFGIVSNGYKCGHQGDPGIYTLVQFYLQWINTTIALL